MDKMIIVDLETQNFPVESGIYEVACLVIENYEIVDKLYLGKEIENYSGSKKYGFGFHDISEDKEMIETFKNFISKYKYPIIAHNCPFDKKFLNHYTWIDDNYPCYCSMRAIRIANKELNSYKLSHLVSHYKINKKSNHTALADVESLFELLKVVQPQNWTEVGKRINSKKEKPRELSDIDLNIETTQKLIGENVCFTGKSTYNRVTMEEIAIKNGAEISRNVTGNTTMLVVGLDAGSKLDKAQEKGISIISDEEFMNILDLSNVQIEGDA